MLVYAYSRGGATTAVAITAGVPMAAYAAAVVASTAVTATRPAQSTLIPSLAVTPDQLTAANVVMSWVEAAGIAAAGSLTGVLIWSGGVAGVFGVCAALGVLAAFLVFRLRSRRCRGRSRMFPRWWRAWARVCVLRSGSRGCEWCWRC